MTTNFPSGLDAFTNPSATDAMDSATVPHAAQHANLNDAVEALQAKVGVDGSAVTTSLDYKVANTHDVPRVLVKDSNGQSLSSPYYNDIGFDEEAYDSHGMHSTTTNNGRLTVQTGWAGYYWVWAGAVCTANGQYGSIRKNGSVLVYGLGATGSDRPAVYSLIPLNVGDYVEFSIYSSGGGSVLGGISLGGYSPQFGALWVAPL